MLTIYYIGLPVAALLAGFFGADDFASPPVALILIIIWPLTLMILIGAVIRDLTDTLRYNRRRKREKR